MKIACPHCTQRISLDAEALASLAGASGFACPACGGHVPLSLPDDGSDAPTQVMGEDPPQEWEAPAAEDIARVFDQRYRIGRLLGRGGMGAVYEGFDTRLDRRVAVKILPAETVGDAAALARFEREAKTMAALDHPHIVHIHDYGRTTDGHPFLVMEFIDGMDIHALRRSGQLDLPGALEIVSQVCSALHFAHSRGIVHRDIKPANILVTREGVAKVGDFGLAKVLGTETHPSPHPTLTLSGSVMGTPDYMAPEQMEGGHVDHRADIYSLGVMLYDLLTGAPPRGAWPPPSQRVHIDVRLDEIVLRALQQNPSSRYQAAAEVRGDIDSVKSTTGGGPLPPGVDPEPLPSTRAAAVPDARRTTSAPSSAGKTSTKPSPPADEILATTRSLNTTMMTLGLLALVTIGGLALHLANRKTGDTYNTEQTITTSVTHNTFFTQIINAGLATAGDLAAISDIRRRGETLIGISKEPLSWDRALALAQKTGASIIALDSPFGGTDDQLVAWLRESFAPRFSQPVWVIANGLPHVLSGKDASLAGDLATPRAVLLRWNMQGDQTLVPGLAGDSARPPVPRHRWSFSGNLNDSIGGAHGTIIDAGQPTAGVTGNQLDLSRNGGEPSSDPAEDAYVSLPGRIVNKLGGKISFEIWCTQTRWTVHANIFRFERSSTGGVAAVSKDALYRAIGLLQRTSDDDLLGFVDTGTKSWLANAAFNLHAGKEHHFALVLDPDNHAAGPAGTLSLYLDGRPVATQALPPGFLDFFEDNNNWLGRGFGSDPMFTGCYNEFRLYDKALTPEEVLASYLAGPDAEIRPQ